MRAPRLAARLLTLLILLTLALIWGNSLDSRADSLNKSGRVVELIKPILLKLPIPALHTPEGMSGFVRKGAHFAEFFILGAQLALLFRLQRPGRRWSLLPLLPGVLAACVDEGLQYFSGRAPMLQDVALDSLGVLCAVLLVPALWRGRGKARTGGMTHA